MLHSDAEQPIDPVANEGSGQLSRFSVDASQEIEVVQDIEATQELEENQDIEAVQDIEAANEFIKLFEFNPDGVIVTTLTDRKILAVNPGFLSISEYSPNQILGQNIADLPLWAGKNYFSGGLRELNRGSHSYGEQTLVTRSKKKCTGLVSTELIEIKSRPFLLCIIRDVTNYVSQLQSLQQYQIQLKTITEIAALAINSRTYEIAIHKIIKCLQKVSQYPVVVLEQFRPERQSISFLAAEGLQYSDETILETDVSGALVEEVITSQQLLTVYSSNPQYWAKLSPILQNQSLKTVTLLPLVADGQTFGILSLGHTDIIRPHKQHIQLLSKVGGFAATYVKRKQTEESLHHHAFHDPLTKLPNRSLFNDRLEQALQRAQRNEQDLYAVLFLDLDGFKVINDSLGHDKGDTLLVEVAQRLTSCLRPGDTVARLGGDEFAFLLENITHPKDAIRVAERINKCLEIPFSLKEQEVFTTASIGITIGAPHYTEPKDILRDADTAMYKAKDMGKGQHVLFDLTMHQEALEQLRLETELRRAINGQELRVYYQPTISIATGKIEQLEALVRWQHPERGLLRPRDFMAIAEDSTLVTDIDGWMLNQVCNDICGWKKQSPNLSPPPVALNLSAKQLQSPNLSLRFKDLINQLAIGPSSLRVEFTESSIGGSVERISKSLQELNSVGIHASIDDFGKGYFALAHLYNFPIDCVKIDKSFIKMMEEGGNSLSVVRAISTIAQQLGLSVVAEGVETQEQLNLLKVLGCDFAQGYYFSRPVLGENAWDLFVEEFEW